MFAFTKHTQSNESTKVVFYTPVHASNVLRYTHVITTFTPQKKEGEETEPESKTVEYIGIEMTLVAEQPQAVPVKAMRRVKQTKAEEFFYVEEVAKVMQPLLQRVEEAEEIKPILEFLEKNIV